MTVHKLSAGVDGGYSYLTQQVASAGRRRAGGALADYYAARGNPPGVWLHACCNGRPAPPYLTDLHRFSDPAEAGNAQPASGPRGGAGLQNADNRIRAGSPRDAMVKAAYDAWGTDVHAGLPPRTRDSHVKFYGSPARMGPGSYRMRCAEPRDGYYKVQQRF
ncbi:MAG TPA: hypothetical protein VF049_00530 [Nocardioidaceae bacterium]|jgi:hypothetical protein